jgi:hypothetical protein
MIKLDTQRLTSFPPSNDFVILSILQRNENNSTVYINDRILLWSVRPYKVTWY